MMVVQGAWCYVLSRTLTLAFVREYWQECPEAFAGSEAMGLGYYGA